MLQLFYQSLMTKLSTPAKIL